MPLRRQCVLAVGLTTLLLVSTASAEQAHTLSGSRHTISARFVLDSAHIVAVVADAQALAVSGHVHDAIKSLRSLATAIADADDYVPEPLRRLAILQFASGQDRDAARTLEELADAAQRFGDPASRLRALFDEALIYQELREVERLPELMQRIDPLLKSPAIDEKVRAEIAARIVRTRA